MIKADSLRKSPCKGLLVSVSPVKIFFLQLYLNIKKFEMERTRRRKRNFVLQSVKLGNFGAGVFVFHFDPGFLLSFYAL